MEENSSKLDEQVMLMAEHNSNIQQPNMVIDEHNVKMLEQNTEMAEQNMKIEEHVLLIEEQNLMMQQQNTELGQQNMKIEEQNTEMGEHVMLMEEQNLRIQQQNMKMKKDNQKKEMEEPNLKMEGHNVKMLEQNTEMAKHNAKMLEHNLEMEKHNVKMQEKNMKMEEQNKKMKEHIILMKETNSKMEKHNMKMLEQNIEKKEQMNDESISSSGCTSSIKAMWPKSAWLRTVLGIFFMDIALYSYDIISDMRVIIDLYQRSHTGLFLTSLTFFLFPMVLTNFSNLTSKLRVDTDPNNSNTRLRLGDVTAKQVVAALLMLITPFYAVYLGFLRMKNLNNYTMEQFRMKTFEVFFEAGPQLILQIYIVTSLPLTSFYVYFGSILASFLSVHIGWTKFIVIIMINQNGNKEHWQRGTGEVIRMPTFMEMLRCSLLLTLWDTLLFFFLVLIIVPPFPFFGHIILFSIIYCFIELNFPGQTMTIRLTGKIIFYIICTCMLSFSLFLLQEPAEKCLFGHNTCYFSKLSSREDVNVTFCPYELNATSTEINCCHNNVYSEDIVMYYIPAAFALIGLSTGTLFIEYAFFRFYQMTSKDCILTADL